MHKFEALTAPSLHELIERGVTTAVVPFGSIEYQDPYLPIGADALVADRVAAEVARRLGALLLPTFRVGHAPSHARVPGTLTIAAATLADVAVESGQSLAQNGVRVVALLSTHGGNQAPLEVAANRLNGASVGALACAPHGDLGPDPGTHSGEWLTSVLLALAPELVRFGEASEESARELREASAERGAQHLERFVSSIVAHIRAVEGQVR